MKNTPKYAYKLRPGYGSKELLIELDGKAAPDDLLTDLILLFGQSGFQLVELKDGWQKDELQYLFRSAKGSVILARDNWECFFILGENGNQADILEIDRILFKNPLFDKQHVNHSDYQ